MPATMNPVFDLLDMAVVAGRAEETFLHVPDPADPDTALSVSHEDALDRVAKIAGVLRLLEIGRGTPVLLSDSVSAPTARLLRLAAFRIGATLMEAPDSCKVPLPAEGVRFRRATASEAPSTPLPTAPSGAAGGGAGNAPGQGASGASGTAGEAAAAAFRKVARRIPSYVEDVIVEYVDIEGGLSTAALDALVRDARIEPGAIVEVAPETPLWDRGDGCVLTAAEVAAQV
ncbi:hypothetical protein [Brevibacterium litoralis]|uniref:hypothetical protein n=1 Tax=Brevibacterium litoralis TaxID=3138935 RepID=UPI0032EECD42